MKYKISTLILAAGLITGNLWSQACGTCTPAPGCFAQGGTQCPLSGQAPHMTQYQPYQTDVTFYMPKDTNISGIGNVQIVNVDYVSITGLPVGISWQCNNNANGCNYNPWGGEQLACIRFCGSPLSPPGNYTATINIQGTANTPFGQFGQAQQLQYVFTIDAPTSGNAYYNFTPVGGCDSATVNFTANVNTSPPQITTYAWNFGNGNNSTVANPPAQTYSVPGAYYPSLTTTIYNTVLNSLSANVTGGWWCGDIEELNCGNGNADLQFTLNHGAGNYTSSEIANTITPSWNNLGVVLQSWTLTFSFQENDTGPPFGSPNDNGGATTVIVNGPGTYNGSTTAITSGGGGVNFSFTVTQSQFSNNTTTDTINIFTSPSVPLINAAPNDTVCELNPVTLTAPAGNYLYEWFNAAGLLTDSAGNMITVLDSGAYMVRITDLATGCSSQSAWTYVAHYPGVYNTTISNTGGVLSVSGQAGNTYQWLYNNTPVFPNGTGQILTPAFTGNYSVIATNVYGCSDTSNVINLTSLVGLQEAPAFSDVLLFPNPATQSISLNFEAFASGDINFTIIDAMGRQVFEEQRYVPQGKYIKAFDLNGLANGVYMIRMQSEKNVKTLRFIKN